MKILSVCVSIPGEGSGWWRVSNIVKLLRSNGHEVKVVYYVKKSSYEKLEKKERYKQDTFVRTSIPTVHIKHFKTLLKDDYDFVYGNSHASTFCSLLGKLTRIPLIFDMHGGLVEEFIFKNKFGFNPKFLFELSQMKLIDFIDLRFSDKVLCVSKKMIGYFHEQKGTPIGKMAYVTNGVDLEFFKPLNTEKVKNIRGRLGLENKIIFGYIGAFHKYQGVKSFIEASKKTNDNNLAFLIVGGEKKLRDNNLIFVTRIPRAQIPYYYAICDVLVLPRPSHPATEIAAPTKFAEYTAMGKPILTTNVGDAAELVRRYKCGIVVENNKPESLVKGIVEFKNISINERETMARNSRKLAESEFDWKKVGTNLVRVIKSLK